MSVSIHAANYNSMRRVTRRATFSRTLSKLDADAGVALTAGRSLMRHAYSSDWIAYTKA